MDGPQDEKVLRELLHPLVAEWFFGKFPSFSLTQLYGVGRIIGRENILVSAPTGGTKTLTAFLGILNYLVGIAAKGELEDKVYAVYTSPLKALSNDIHVNLEAPLAEIRELAEKKGIELQEIRVGLRTGDTTPSERAKQARKAPHIYVTTPESLAIVLTTKKFVEKLAAVEFVIVDEVHALTNKRGVYLSVTLERLAEISVFDPVRIGLSATVAPLEEVAHFLVGEGRDCGIAVVPLVKGIDISLDFPGKHVLEAESLASQELLYEQLDGLIESHKTTLIFTNTRAATERIVHYLDDHFPGKYSDVIGAHHSSMSKEERFSIEERLRNGELKVIVSSTSLELGIDIGSIDLVVLLRSPKSVSRALQRLGRAGHQLHSQPKGKFLVMDRGDLVECSILMKRMREKEIDEVQIPKGALDVLAQQIYGMAISKIWQMKDMLSLVRRSYCYASLSKEDFLEVVSYLCGEYALEHRHVYAKIWYEPSTGEIGKKGKLARVLYMTNIGTIPEEGFVEVVIGAGPERGASIGKIDEAFLEKMKRGDVFTLGGKKYEFLSAAGMKARVRSAEGRRVTIPSWFSEMLPLHYDIGQAIARFYRLVEERLPDGGVSFVREYVGCSAKAAKEIVAYVDEQRLFSEVPHDRKIVVERYKEEKEYLVFHTLVGRRVNDVLARAFAFAAGRLRMRDVEMGIHDHGFYLAGERLDVGKILAWLKGKELWKVIKEAIEKTEVLKRRFRHCAARGLMILRQYKGREKSVGKQQVHSMLLFSAVKRFGDGFPILVEAKREVMEDLMDLDRAEAYLKRVFSGSVEVVERAVPIASPFGLGIVMQGRQDLLRMEDRVSFLKRMHELHLKAIAVKKG
ncbi:ATP-dependent helicase [Candidatus Pacearchaeota archaeon]|nr:ATP-dependent helicase [Candidatus Pacearchaeota archaeon]